MSHLFQVDVHGQPSNEVSFVRAVRLAGAIPLRDAVAALKNLRLKGRLTVAAGLELEIAEQIATSFREIEGCVADVSKSSVLTPLVCAKNASYSFTWGLFRTIVKRKIEPSRTSL